MRSIEGLSLLLLLGSKESSFLEAITSAGVAYQVTKGCSQGNWEMCGCDSRVSGVGHKSGEMSWEWGGCSEDYRFGYDYSTKFMDPAKNEKRMPDMVTRHNNEAGRKVCRCVPFCIYSQTSLCDNWFGITKTSLQNMYNMVEISYK